MEPACPPGASKRICFITVEFHGLFKNGGIGTANTALALALAAEGFDVTVAVGNADANGPRLKTGDFTALVAHYAGLGITLDYVRPHPHIAGAFDEARTASYCVYQYVRQGGFDAVLFNDNGGQGYYSVLAKHAGVFPNPPLLGVVAHGPLDWVHELNALDFHARPPIITAYMEERSAGLADLLISPSQYLLDWMRKRGWLQAGQGRMIPNLVGVDARLAGRFRQAGPRPVREIVFFGRQETRKGLSLFCDAVDRLEKTTSLAGISITFLGKFSKIGGLHGGIYLAERARLWQAELRILVTRDQAEALDYLARPGVLAVIPSRAENAPCVVAECLQLGLLFLATDTGGTAELVDPADREICLFPPDEAALSARLLHILTHGHVTARPAVRPADTLTEWVTLLRAPRPGDIALPTATPLVSVCLVFAAGPAFRACLEAVQRQSYERFEIIIALDESPAGPPAGPPAGGPATRFVSGRFGGRGAARNAAAAQSKGAYKLFIDEQSATLLPDAIATLVRAARKTGAAILTAMRVIGPGAEMTHPDDRLWELPLGPCAEMGAVENCFGEAVLLVSAAYFAGAGFAAGCADAALDWLYCATAQLAGARLEVVPSPLFHIREATPPMVTGERMIDAHRDILAAYDQAPVKTVSRILESTLRMSRQNRLHAIRAIAALPRPARELAQKLSLLDPGGNEANRLFVAYLCERHMVTLAMDFALQNDVPFLPEAVGAAQKANAAVGREMVRARRLGAPHTIDLTADLFAHAAPYRGLRQDHLNLRDGLLSHLVGGGPAIVKIAAAGPPGLTALRVLASAGDKNLRLAAVLCRPWARLNLPETGAGMDHADAWWSGWVAVAAGGNAALEIEAGPPGVELLDLFLIAALDEPGADAAASVTWRAVKADLNLNGRITASGIELAASVSMISLQRAEVLTDITKLGFPIFVPETHRAMLHPIPGRLALARVAAGLPAAALGLRCAVSTEHEKARPVEFAVWVRPAAPAALPEAALSETELCSGWFVVDTPFERRTLTLRLAEPAAGPMDIYFATRVTAATDSYFCHAYWHDVAVLETV